MYKIFTLARDGTRPLWTPYMTEKEVIIVPPVTDETTEDIITPAVTETQTVEYEVETLEELEATVKELLSVIPSKQIRAVEDLSYVIDVLFSA